MVSSGFLDAIIPLRFRKSVPVVTHVRLDGAIGIGTPMRPALTLKSVNDTLERAFGRKGISAVAISVNSPGGSAVQSALIHTRIRQLAGEKKLPVLVFCEDVAASGGYWLACAGDQIYADESSVVGSIGVIYAGFGYVDAIAKLGIERRVHTAGENKSILDPFKPERIEDVEHLKSLQAEIHDAFKTLVKARRGARLKTDDPDIFSGAFWAGRQALARGLVDGIGHLHQVLKDRFGDKLVVKNVTPSQGWGLKRLGFGIEVTDIAENTMDVLETRALWSRFGL
ncbi:MAG: S49 family peptidase [Aestuariivirga sp.]|uniref:S49 family peptidase n=1 Tax=Aestuariivirga sp. TaxID=2650926 RepID=UPI0025C0A9E8|nr:S49 family peptidase [Aestuariivirga sp.]MCA3559417.1 S49 family peptidase [Aestuariivirga sp.]